MENEETKNLLTLAEKHGLVLSSQQLQVLDGQVQFYLNNLTSEIIDKIESHSL